MAASPLLARWGLRVGLAGSSAALALAIGTAADAAARIGAYVDTTAGAEQLGIVVGGVSGPVFTRSGTAVNASIPGTLTVASLTSGRVPIVSTAGLLVDSANFTFSGSTATITDGTFVAQVGANFLRFNRAGSNSFVDQAGIGGSVVIRSTTTTTADVTAASFSNTAITLSLPTTVTGAVTLSTASSGLTIAKTSGTTLVVSSTAANSVTLAGGATIGGTLTVNGGTSASGVGTVVIRQTADSSIGGLRLENTDNSGAFRIWKGAGGSSATTITDTGVDTIQLSAGIVTIPKTTGTTLVVSSTTASTSSTTGAFTVAGGAGIAGACFVEGVVQTNLRFAFGNAASAYTTSESRPIIYSTGSGGSGIFSEAGNLVLSPRISGAQRDVIISTRGTGEDLRVDRAGNVVLGQTAALATNATNGFAYMPTCAGTPTGTPTAYTGKVAWVYDTTNNIIYVYNGAWKKTAALT